MTPKRILSPLKKFNRVAPSQGSISERGTLKFSPEEDASLKSSSASLLEQKVKSLASSGRPDSAPQAEQNNMRQGVPIDARVIIKSGSEEVDIREMEGSCIGHSFICL